MEIEIYLFFYQSIRLHLKQKKPNAKNFNN
jgi:hypothetical protein